MAAQQTQHSSRHTDAPTVVLPNRVASPKLATAIAGCRSWCLIAMPWLCVRSLVHAVLLINSWCNLGFLESWVRPLFVFFIMKDTA